MIFNIEQDKHYAQTTYREEYREFAVIIKHPVIVPPTSVLTDHEPGSLTTTDLPPPPGSPPQPQYGLQSPTTDRQLL